MKKTIKIIALLLGSYLAQYPFSATSQNYIEYKNTGIVIKSNAMSSITNSIRYEVLCSISEIDTAQKVLNIIMTCVGGKCTYGSEVQCPNMPSIFAIYKVESEDVEKTVGYVTDSWGANLIYSENLLKLDTTLWSVKNE